MQNSKPSTNYVIKSAFILITILFSLSAMTMEVGHITVLSKLGEPLHAELTIKKHQQLTEQELIIQQAPAMMYKKMGVDNSTLFLRLNFKINTNGVVTVTSNQLIKEPFINFILRFSWPTGELYREFKLLIDPA